MGSVSGFRGAGFGLLWGRPGGRVRGNILSVPFRPLDLTFEYLQGFEHRRTNGPTPLPNPNPGPPHTMCTRTTTTPPTVRTSPPRLQSHCPCGYSGTSPVHLCHLAVPFVHLFSALPAPRCQCCGALLIQCCCTCSVLISLAPFRQGHF